MKISILIRVIILLFFVFSNNLMPDEIRFIHKIAEEELFSVQGPYTEQFGDSIMFWSVVLSPKPDSVKYYDSTQIDFFLMTYHNGVFDSIPKKQIIDFNFGDYNSLSQIIKDKNGDIIFAFDCSGLYRISNGKILRYDSLLKALNIKKINSLSVDNSNELYIHSGSRIMKFSNDKIDTIVNGYFDINFQISPFKSSNLFCINDKMYYWTFNNSIAYFNIETQSVDSVSIYEKCNLLVKDLSLIYINNQFDEYFNIVLITKANIKHFARFYPETNQIEMLDYIRDAVLRENLPYDKLWDYGFDKNKNCYVNFIGESSILDSFYIVSTDQKIKRYCTISDSWPYNGGYTLKIPKVLSNGDVILPALQGLFIIPGEGTSVEAPKNLIFMKNLYPNPARDRIKVDFGVEPVNLSSTKLEIYDYLGRLAMETNPEIEYNSSTGNGTMTCDISQLRTGYYIVVLTNGKFSRSTPLFVE